MRSAYVLGMARRDRAYTLGELPPGPVEIECKFCDRHGKYDRDRLIARYGADMDCPSFLNTISADCTHYPPLSTIRVCGAHFAKPIDEGA
ncbi:MAG: hypothetical protein WDN29_16475 [Methylovirgula sp.]